MRKTSKCCPPRLGCCSVTQSRLTLCTPWTAARLASLSSTISSSLLKLTSFESMMPSNHLILCFPFSWVSTSNYLEVASILSLEMHVSEKCCCWCSGSQFLFEKQWTEKPQQASLSFANSYSLLRLMSKESVMPSKHLILCHSLLLLPSICPSIRVFFKSLLFASGGQSIGNSVSASVLPMNIQG